jgi:acetyl-CoA C-acetyltransferase
MRERPGTGLVHANGGYATKHAFGVYGTEPPEQPFRVVDVREAAADLPTRTADHAYVGTATIEGYTVMHDRDNAPTHALIALRTPDDARTWGTTRDPGRLAAMCVDEHVGRAAEIDPDGLVAA